MKRSISVTLGLPDVGARSSSRATSPRCGPQWHRRETEGSYYVGETGTWLRSRFGRLLPPSWNEYLRQREIEIKEGFSEDAGLLISWEQLRLRITFWETFLARYPDFPLKGGEIATYLDIYIRTFLTGTDNSRIERDYQDLTLRDEVRKAYDDFLRKNRGSRYYSVVKGYYDILKKENFRVGREARSFLQANGVKSMHAVQPPTY